MGMPLTQDQQTPMASMNMTPLIDVLLVLLIMFVVTIPVATHSLPVDIGGGHGDPEIRLITNKLVVTPRDEILWNGTAVTPEQLDRLLRTSTTIAPEPELQYQPEALASYQTSAEVLRQIKLAGVTKFGFVGNEKHGEFDQPPS